MAIGNCSLKLICFPVWWQTPYFRSYILSAIVDLHCNVTAVTVVAVILHVYLICVRTVYSPSSCNMEDRVW